MKVLVDLQQSVVQGTSAVNVETIDLPNRKNKVWKYDGVEIMGRTDGATVISLAQGMIRLHPLGSVPEASSWGISTGGGVCGAVCVNGGLVAGGNVVFGVESPEMMNPHDDIYFVDGFMASLALSLAATTTGSINSYFNVLVYLTEVTMTREVQAELIAQLS